MKRTEPEPQVWVDYDRKREDLITQYGRKAVLDYIELRYKLDQSQRSYDADTVLPADLYFKTAGEIEARDSSARRTLTAEQRKNIRPDIDREDVVFSDDNVRYISRYSYDDFVAKPDMNVAIIDDSISYKEPKQLSKLKTRPSYLVLLIMKTIPLFM